MDGAGRLQGIGAWLGLVVVVGCGGQTAATESTAAGEGGAGAPDGTVMGTPHTDASSPTPAEAGVGVGTIPCGNHSTCNAATQVCCTESNMAPTCTAMGQCMGASLDCVSSANCQNGDICCGSFAGMASATCTPRASCTGVELCQGVSDCPAGDRCAGMGTIRICVPGGGPGFDGGFGFDGGAHHFDGGFPFDGSFPPPPGDAGQGD